MVSAKKSEQRKSDQPSKYSIEALFVNPQKPSFGFFGKKKDDNFYYMDASRVNEVIHHVKLQNIRQAELEAEHRANTRKMAEDFQAHMDLYFEMVGKRLEDHLKKHRDSNNEDKMNLYYKAKKYQEDSEGWMKVLRSQSKQLQAIATPDRGDYMPSFYDGIGTMEAAKYVSEFEFFVKMRKLPITSKFLTTVFRHHLTGYARKWVDEKLNYETRGYFGDFNGFIDDFLEKFAKNNADFALLDHVSLPQFRYARVP